MKKIHCRAQVKVALLKFYFTRYGTLYFINQCLLFFPPAVRPRVSLTFSEERVKSGSNVTVTCTAESYPPPNSTNFFLQHPPGTLIRSTLSVENGVQHTIYHANRSNSGKYGCTVIVSSSQQNTTGEYLIVYGELAWQLMPCAV